MHQSEQGYQTVAFAFAAAMSLLLFTLFANVLVVQFGRAALRSAVDDAARAGAREGADQATCQSAADQRLTEMVRGDLGRDVTVRCTVGGESVEVRASGAFRSWIPGVPDFDASATGRSVRESGPR